MTGRDANKRKRAPGGGRKPDPNKKIMFSTRLEPATMAALKSTAKTRNGGSVSRLAERLIEKGLRAIEDEERDPALQSLLFVIAQLTADITGERLTPDSEFRSLVQNEWRNDLFEFRAFKVAVKKLLDALEEPPAEPDVVEKEKEQIYREGAEKYGPEFSKMYMEMRKSPEAYGSYIFGKFWARFLESDLPLTESVRRAMQQYPILGQVIEREYYGFQKARKALEPKSRAERLEEGFRLVEQRGKKLPSNVEEAQKFLGEVTGERLPVEEAQMLVHIIKARKAKGQNR